MYQFPEKRRYHRHDQLDTLFLHDQDQPAIQVILFNYSEAGIYIKTPRRLQPGKTLHITASGSLKDRIAEDCYGKVVWCSPVISEHPHFRAGIKFSPVNEPPEE